MRYDPDKHHRRSIRLKGYDYSKAGWYFITLCSKNRERLFGNVDNGEMVINEYGKIIRYSWFDLRNHNNHIRLDAFMIMPNHVHGIIQIIDVNDVRAGSEPALTKKHKQHSLSEIIRQFKTFSARRINKKRNMTGIPVWQRNYYEHIIRDDEELNRIRLYIKYNTLNWKDDDYHI